MDAFFVSVELLRRPELRGKPVVVGGTGERGVVAAASYEARRYGVFSAMPSAIAQRRCPQAIFLPGDHAHYGEVSAKVFEVFQTITPLVEGLSLDEAFLDVSGALRLFGTAQEIAARIRADVLAQTGLTCSVGIAPNKFLAKLASEAAKPKASPSGVRPGLGIKEVLPGGELEFLHPLAVQAMWGVGPATLAKLQRLGVTTIADLAELGEATLVASLGASSGRHLHRLSRALDDRPVEPNREAKSIGHEETYPTDLFDGEEIRAQVVRLSDAVASRLRQADLTARTITLKVRFAGFDTITRANTPGTALSTGPGIAAVALALLEAVDLSRGIRLLGISAAQFEAPPEQLSLDGLLGGDAVPSTPAAVEQAWHEASSAIDDVRARFGANAIGPTSSLVRGRLQTVRRGAQTWGPDRPPEEPGDQSAPGRESM